MLNKNEFLLLEDFSDYNRFQKFQPIDDRVHVNERFSIIIDHRNNTNSIAFIFDWNFFILAGNNDMHKSLDEFEFQPDPTIDIVLKVETV